MNSRNMLWGMFAFVISCALLAQGGIAQDKDKAKDKEPRAALPPHPLDSAFGKAMNETGISNGLLNNPLYKQAVKNALKGKRDMEAKYKENPKLRAATPEQAARMAFLDTLLQKEPEKDAPKKDEK